MSMYIQHTNKKNEELDMSMKIERPRGDTYPLKVGIRLDGVLQDFSISVIKLSYKRSDDVITVDGVALTTDPKFNIRFDFVEAQVDEAGRFPYDIQVITGNIIRTFIIDEIEFAEDVTK